MASAHQRIFLGWMVPQNHLWSLKFNGRERHYATSTFMETVILPLFKAAFPDADDYPRGFPGLGEQIVYLTMNTPTRVWIEEQQNAIVRFVMETLKLPNPPMWYRSPWQKTMKPLYKQFWPNAHEIEYEQEVSDSDMFELGASASDSDSEDSDSDSEDSDSDSEDSDSDA
ncbi:hypothetical protein C8F01DRAFT_1118862 [Mycena amicta]|nr:hypothetical protein C8F01DRAFT_1118862 [Mycena amicta]